MAASGNRFFLSYRREDSAGHAGRLADHLLDRFGSGSVFMDVESIEAGADFTEEIAGAIEGSDAVLVVIGPGWADARTSAGARRLDEAADFVRREIEAALASDVRVIPVLVGGATMPAGADLPSSIASLTRLNALELLDRRWREDVDALVDVLEGRGRGTVGNLPVQPTPFLGRERELNDITDLLRRDEVRLLTLTGPGGIGKTRLAVQAATRLAHTYPGGSWFVGLAAVTDPALVLMEIATVLEIREVDEDAMFATLAARLSRARTLIVLDNLEQLLPDAAHVVARLLAAAPALDLIAASREPLRVGAEREYPVATLSDDEAAALFVARARATRPGYEPADEVEETSIAELCVRLDRLPLAIELAAPRIAMLAPAELLGRLEERLPLLTGGARDAPERQRTLRATIAWSVDLLAHEERELFERLSVFSGGWTLEAAEAVCDADVDTLQSLLQRNLIRRSAGDGRFEMLETIREFAIGVLAGRPDDHDVRTRHLEYFLDLAEVASPHLRSGPDQARWADRLDAEHDNYRAALRWALDGDDPARGLSLAVHLYWLWFLRRPLAEGRRWLMEALDRAPGPPSADRAMALVQAGSLIGQQGEDPTALIEEGLRCAREARVLTTQALAMTVLSLFTPADRTDEMVSRGEEAVRLARASGDRWVLSSALNNLGEAFRESGRVPEAIGAYEESYAILAEIGDDARRAILMANLAETAIVASDLERAGALSAESLALAEELGDRATMAQSRAVLGWVALGGHDAERAAEEFKASLALLRDVGDWRSSLNVLIGLAGMAAMRSEVERAARLEAAAGSLEVELRHQPSAADAGIHHRYLNQLRDATDPAVWEGEARAGEAMTLDEAIAFALRS